MIKMWLKSALALCFSLIPLAQVWAAPADGNSISLSSHGMELHGGGNGVMVVESKDAQIWLEPNPIHRLLILDSKVFNQLWDGVMDGTFGYLRIGHCRFILDFDESRGLIMAYDWSNSSYIVESFEIGQD